MALAIGDVKREVNPSSTLLPHLLFVQSLTGNSPYDSWVGIVSSHSEKITRAPMDGKIY